MNWLELANNIFEVCIIPLLGVLTAYLIGYINTKRSEITGKTDSELAQKYVNMLAQTITDCVIATNQTYVDALKGANAFDAEAQKVAFQKTFDSVMGVLTDDAKDYLAAVYGDLTTYITMKIEAEVKLNK